MANSKNTIQNIPLEAELCMNALKTEVKQFQGYNEKNTTLYGGTLSPMWDNKKELPFDKDNSYTFFNSKGEDFTLVKEQNVEGNPQMDDYNRQAIHLYKGDTRITTFVGDYLGKTEELEVPPYTKAALKLINGDLVTYRQPGVRTEYNNGVYINDVRVVDVPSYNYSFYRIWSFRDFIVVGLGYTFDNSLGKGASVHLYCIYDNGLVIDTNFYGVIPDGATDKIEPHLVGGLYYHPNQGTYPTFSLTLFSGRIKTPITSYTTFFNDEKRQFTRMTEEPNVTYVEQGFRLGKLSTLDEETIELQQCICRSTKHLEDSSGNPGTYWTCKINGALQHDGVGAYHCYATDEDGFIPTPIGAGGGLNDSSPIIAYWLKGSLISLSDLGRPIDECLGYGQNTFNTDYYSLTAHGITARITYVKKDGTWCTYSRYKVAALDDSVNLRELLKACIVGGRYVFLNGNYGVLSTNTKYFDIETLEITKDKDFGWILSTSPYCVAGHDEASGETTGVVFANGINAGFEISNTELVGYLPNPYIGFNLPKKDDIHFSGYYTVGDTAQSAEYHGINPQYYGTTYPIDPNGNVVLPISMNAQIMEGYSNNDMVKEGDTAYPLIYWNNNQKVYAYYLLAGIENITNVFSLQGQQYAVDDENIYTVAFNGGVVSQVQSVSYKKNLTFLGTLPTQAVFWSDYNKTFYAFTGDRVLSKMFEASDIHKILYVGQNPSSLSLWVCTDTGIYVLSDTDQFRLDYVSKMVEFLPKTTLLLTEGEENNEIHAVSLYLDEGEEGEMVPVKLETSYYGLGNEMKAVMDCWYLRLFDENNTKGYVKAKVHTITDITRHTEEKTFEINPSDYDENHIVYLRFQPKYQECVSMQLELETNLGIYQISLGVNTTDSTAQVSKFNF